MSCVRSNAFVLRDSAKSVWNRGLGGITRGPELDILCPSLCAVTLVSARVRDFCSSPHQFLDHAIVAVAVASIGFHIRVGRQLSKTISEDEVCVVRQLLATVL